MWCYVYIIRSISSPEQEYIGATADLKRRMADHNAGKSTHTAKFNLGNPLSAARRLFTQRGIQPVTKGDDLVFHRRQPGDGARRGGKDSLRHRHGFFPKGLAL
jgi:GIY-YIG catalytic domain